MADKKNTLTGPQRIKAYLLIKEHSIVIGQNKDGADVIKYNDDWSDEKVAEAIGAPLAAKAVGNTRRDNVGFLLGMGVHGVILGADAGSDKDITALTELVGELRADLNRAVRSINMLAKTEGLTAALIEEKQ